MGSQKWQRPGGGGGGGERLPFAGARPIPGGGGGEERETAAGEETVAPAVGEVEGSGEKDGEVFAETHDRLIGSKRLRSAEGRGRGGHFNT